MAGYGGNVLQLTLGDKGAYLYGVFGSPVAHEDDAARAASAALELRDLDRTTDARDIQIGIALGRLRSGTYGHAMRRTFVCLGDAVNLAARLMSKAPAGSIYVEDVVREWAGDAFIWERAAGADRQGQVRHDRRPRADRLPRTGVATEDPLPARPGRTARRARPSRRRPREDDRGDGRIVGISADAGMGKSRLIAEFVRIARRRGLFVAFGECQSFGTNTSYFVWREIWRRLLGLEDGRHRRGPGRTAPGIARRDRAGAGRAGAARWRPSSASRSPTRRSRPRWTRSCGRPRSRTSSRSSFGPDRRASRSSSSSRTATGSTRCRATCSRSSVGTTADLPGPDRPCLSAGHGARRRDRRRTDPRLREIVLDELRGDDALGLIRLKLEQVAPDAAAADIPDAFVELLMDRSGGNPFYIEELISWIAAQRRRPGRRRGAPPPRAARQPPQPRPVADRLDVRRAAPDAEGRERRRSGVRGADPAGRVPGARDARRRPRPARRTPGGRPRQPRSRPRARLPVQARRDPGGRLREPAVRAAGAAPRPWSATGSSSPIRTASIDASTSSPTTSG